jgi:HD-GYP domain-containing protein (c-di-GMP phosphodiesterase class II)
MGPRVRPLRPGTISLVLLVLSVPYILYSDRWLLRIAGDPVTLTEWQTVKGWAYVVVAAGVVFLLELWMARRHRQALATQRQAYDAAIEGWARALDLREHETGGHARRVTELAQRLGKRLGLRPDELENLRHGALLHDVGKIGVRDAVLSKPGPLDEDEWTEMRHHTVLGHELLLGLPELREATTVVRSHHEHWDGGGYPDGLAGEAIPRLARVFAVVDVYDALRSDRPYRRAWTEDEVRAYLRAERGRQLDPEAVDAFLDVLGGAAADTPGARPPSAG